MAEITPKRGETELTQMFAISGRCAKTSKPVPAVRTEPNTFHCSCFTDGFDFHDTLNFHLLLRKIRRNYVEFKRPPSTASPIEPRAPHTIIIFGKRIFLDFRRKSHVSLGNRERTWRRAELYYDFAWSSKSDVFTR